jgi:hypothetical protein
MLQRSLSYDTTRHGYIVVPDLAPFSLHDSGSPVDTSCVYMYRSDISDLSGPQAPLIQLLYFAGFYLLLSYRAIYTRSLNIPTLCVVVFPKKR